MTPKFQLRFANNIIEHLGVKLYQNKPTNVIAEYVANGWDAGAEIINVEVVCEGENRCVSITDDGTGMDANQLAERFLVIGLNRRMKSPFAAKNRKPMGRKGIGKLAGFGISKKIDVISSSKNSNGEIEFYPFEFTNELKKLDFDILCIVGGSGSGKSTFSKNYGIEENLVWDNKKSIISHFKNEKEAIEKLSSVGLNSIPTWLKPRNVLSVGEGFRCDLARRIKNNCVIDEFTSTIDREVAISCSTSIGKYIRKNGLKKCVFVSCHKDFIDYLKPSYVIDLDDGVVYDTRRLPKRNIKLQL